MELKTKRQIFPTTYEELLCIFGETEMSWFIHSLIYLVNSFLLALFGDIEIVDHVCKMNRSLKMLTFCEIEYLRIGIHQKSPVTCSTTVQIGIISSFDLKC